MIDIGKELLTTADIDIISIDEKEFDHKTNMMLFKAGLAIDVVFEEQQCGFLGSY